MLGSILYENKLKSLLFQKGFIFDDTGDNISHLNSWFGQLTGLYWTWKNAKEEIIGTNTYRLYWGDYFLQNEFKSNTLYIPQSVNINDCFSDKKEGSNLYHHYSYCHGENGLNFLFDMSLENKIPIKPWMIEDLKNQYLLYPFNMFISEKKIFDKVCDILFDIIFQYYSIYKDYFYGIVEERGQNRVLDFLSERILHIIYYNKDYFIPNINIENVPIICLTHDS
jgi:hypothetical protein